jgi:hypothetical protein
MNIDERIDSIVHVATNNTSAEAAAYETIKGIGRMIFEIEDGDTAESVAAKLRKLAEALDARAEEIAGAVVKSTLSDQQPDGPTAEDADRHTDDTASTTAAPAPSDEPAGLQDATG